MHANVGDARHLQLSLQQSIVHGAGHSAGAVSSRAGKSGCTQDIGPCMLQYSTSCQSYQADRVYSRRSWQGLTRYM